MSNSQTALLHAPVHGDRGANLCCTRGAAAAILAALRAYSGSTLRCICLCDLCGLCGEEAVSTDVSSETDPGLTADTGLVVRLAV